jgi:hypothetical protein
VREAAELGATTCKVLKPDLTLATLVVSNVSTGKFTAPFDTTLDGDLFVRWTGTGTATDACLRFRTADCDVLHQEFR